jgi:hypothetical protein
MSKLTDYTNPLDSFRSYSYHFILTAGSSTETFRKMIGGGGKSLLSAIQSKRLGDEFTVDGSKAYLVVDTRRFSQYSITDVEMEHVYGTGDKNNPTVPSVSMKVKLIDTTGLSFFSFMMDLFRNKLKTSRLSAFFMLSIVFTGHRGDGTTETISTCNIPLIMLLMGFTFNEKGSDYEIEFMETEGAPQRGAPMQLINNLGSVRSISSKKNTIGDMVLSLETDLNRQSLEYYQKYVNTAVSKGESLANIGKLVQYMVTIPDDWAEFEADLAQPAGGGRQISFSSTDMVTDAIKKILEKSTNFLKLASTERVKSGQGYAFKTVTNVTSGQSTYLVHIDIYAYSIPKPNKKAGVLNPGASSNVDAQGSVNLLTYNYIFTGKNSHIEDLKIQYNPESAVALDINLDIGPSRFLNNAERGQTAAAVKESSSGASGKSMDFSPLLRPGDPIFPIKTQNQLNNGAAQYTDYKDAKDARESLQSKQEYDRNYGVLHFLSSITMDMTIRGNPKIIEKFADRAERGGIPEHYDVITTDQLKEIASGNLARVQSVAASVQTALSSYKQSYKDRYLKPKTRVPTKSAGGVDSLKNGLDVAAHPLFARIDIRAPDVDWTGNFLDSSKPYSNKFFFDGDYMVLFVKTTFSGGKFSHTMTMIPYDMDGSYSSSNDSAAR